MKSLIKSIKKLSPRKGDLLIFKIPLSNYNGENVETLMKDLRILKLNVPCLILPEVVGTEFEEFTKGKHKVYLNNLEYLEYLDNQNRKEL